MCLIQNPCMKIDLYSLHVKISGLVKALISKKKKKKIVDKLTCKLLVMDKLID